MNDDHVISLRPSQHAPEQEQAPKPKKRRMRRLFKKLLPLAVIIVIAVAGIFIYINFFKPSSAQSGDPREMITRVSRLMALPDEAPTVAVVSDLEKLKGQAFFARAHAGDIVLMYPKAQKAILYSPSLDKILEVAPITNDTQQ